MKATQMVVWEESGVIMSVSTKGVESLLDILDDGRIVLPGGIDPREFDVVAAAENGLMTMKNVADEGGAYHANALLATKKLFPKKYNAMVLSRPIPVLLEGGFRRTPWHGLPTNRLDYFKVGKDGSFDLFQAGVVIRGGQKEWWPKALGEYRWRGHLYKTSSGALVAVPLHPKWGSFEGGSSQRTQIFSDPGFQAMVMGIKLKTWTGSQAEVDPQLPKPGPGQVVVQFYIPFAGREGQGVVVNINGKSAWVLKQDIIGVLPDADGEIRLWRGDILSFEEAVYDWGSKKGGPPKLTGVQLVKRSW